MNKKLIPLFVFMSVTLIMILITGVFFYEKSDNTAYILKDYNGKIAVFTEEDAHPVEIFDTNTASLPSKDTEALKAGIRVETKEELYRLIEDFSG